MQRDCNIRDAVKETTAMQSSLSRLSVGRFALQMTIHFATNCANPGSDIFVLLHTSSVSPDGILACQGWLEGCSHTRHQSKG